MSDMESTTSAAKLLTKTDLRQPSISHIYSPLDTSKKEIRVLRLFPIPADTNGFIQCTLSTISLRENLDFIPLSYVWGDASKTTEIFVDGISFQATLNLVDFFRHYKFLPEKYQGISLWVDAICINQADLEERGQQVALMTDIYGGPLLTISWLGPSSIEEESDLAVRWIIKISQDITDANDAGSLFWLEKNAKDLLTGSTYGPVWSSIGSLLSRPYWTRVWTTQECVLPEENIFLCGSCYFFYSQLDIVHDALDYICGDGSCKLIATISSAPEDQHYIRRLLTFKYFKSSTLGFSRTLYIKALKIFQRSNGDANKDEELRLIQSWGATYAMRNSSATDPRDFVYGAGGMCPCPLIDIDYTKNIKDLFIEHASIPIRAICNDPTTIYMTSVLGITGFGKSQSVNELPSWVPNWGQTPPIVVFDGTDSSGQNDAAWKQSTLPVAKGPILYVSGVRLSEISFVQQRDEWTLLEFITQAIRVLYSPEYVPIDKFQEVLKAFLRISYEVKADEDGALWEFTCALLVYFLEGKDSSTEEDIERPHFQGEDQPNPNVNTGQKIERMHLILSTFGLYSHGNNPHNFWDHLFSGGLTFPLSAERFNTIMEHGQKKLLQIQLHDKAHKESDKIYFRSEKGHVGFTYGKILPGDILCVILGCCQPAILRKVEDRYVHIGLCFINHLMNGEVFMDENGEPASVEISRFDIH